MRSSWGPFKGKINKYLMPNTYMVLITYLSYITPQLVVTKGGQAFSVM